MFKIGQLFFIKDGNGKRTTICLMEIDKKKNKYIFECCEDGYKHKGERFSIDIEKGNNKLTPNLPILQVENIVEDENRIYIKQEEKENSLSA